MPDDILRQLANLIRFGTVQAVAGKRVQVQVGGLLTRPIPWLSARAGKTKTWSPPDIGEQVLVLSPNGDLGAAIAIGGIFCDAFDIPDDANANTVVMAFGDGAVLLYDQAAHLLKGKLPATGRVEITAPGGFTLTGNVDIDGQLSVSHAATFEQTVHARQDVTSDADVKAGNISLTNHPHGLVKSGTDTSGKPLP
ncbi:phage baseplate assembly protein V [Dyella sp.]|uniref:phage baseplate assembly protein V n=1 Tax=Dyella sp. TaxID=1869338 RepID=UPI002B47C8A5|nr:phage baseplate assembly protein V [Dyella sp.]HKT28802.1 phage baseplate assembly protein V [Dyella sp.]